MIDWSKIISHGLCVSGDLNISCILYDEYKHDYDDYFIIVKEILDIFQYFLVF